MAKGSFRFTMTVYTDGDSKKLTGIISGTTSLQYVTRWLGRVSKEMGAGVSVRFNFADGRVEDRTFSDAVRRLNELWEY